jgi:hypothetical protein
VFTTHRPHPDPTPHPLTLYDDTSLGTEGQALGGMRVCVWHTHTHRLCTFVRSPYPLLHTNGRSLSMCFSLAVPGWPCAQPDSLGNSTNEPELSVGMTSDSPKMAKPVLHDASHDYQDFRV